ncbi:ABC transporter ATP-binding protein [soil metagenome]
MSAVLESLRVRRGYTTGRGRVDVLRGVDLRIEAGEVVAILGPSGSGKSTLLHLFAALDTPDDGEVLWSGGRVTHTLPDIARRRAAHVGLVFQHHYLLAELDALENVTLPARIRGRDVSREGRDLLVAMGLGERVDAPLHALSGGERQRVAVARAMVLRPAVLLADEPTGSLDRASAIAVYALLRALARERGSAIVIVTHDEGLVADADRRLRLVDGTLHATT